MTLSRLSIPCLLVLSLASCGGGGGTAPAAPPPVVNPALAGMTLFAGELGGFGNIDGTGAAARFSSPTAVAADGAGNVYVADGSTVIRKVSADGAVGTFAGKADEAGTVDAKGSAARFSGLSDLVIDSAGTLFAADAFTIRKITGDGQVSTYFDTRTATGSNSGQPWSIGSLAADANGNLYAIDTDTKVVRKIAPDHSVVALAGKPGGQCHLVGRILTCEPVDGTGGDAAFAWPQGLTVDQSGNVFVNDSGHIRRVTPQGEVSTIPLGTTGTPGYGFNRLAADRNGGLILSTTGGIVRRAADGSVTVLAGTLGDVRGAADGQGAQAGFSNPTGVTVASDGVIYVADTGNSTIRKLTPAGAVTTLAGRAPGSGLVADIHGVFGAPADGSSMAIDGDGNIYGAAPARAVVVKVDAMGRPSVFAGQLDRPSVVDGPAASALLASPLATARDGAGNLYVLGSSQVRKIAPDGSISSVAGAPYMNGAADGSGSAARFTDQMRGVAVDAKGVLYVTDRDAVRKVTPAGDVTTLAGAAVAWPEQGSGSADGPGAAARFNAPAGIALDRAGNVYVADSGNYTVRKITPDGQVSTLAGKAGEQGAADGAGVAARFGVLNGLVVDDDGNVYAADTGNHTIRRITPAGVVTTVAGQAGAIGIRLGALPGTLGDLGALAIKGQRLFVRSEGAIVAIDLPK